MALEEGNNSALEALVICGLVFNLIVAGIVGYGAYLIHQKRECVEWSARHFGPLFFMVCWGAFFIGFERNMQLLGSVQAYFDLTSLVRWLLNNVFTLGFLCAYGLRCWLVHFDYHTGVAMFVRVTNIKLSSGEEEHFGWFLANKTNYGSPKYLQQFLIAMNVVINVLLFGWVLMSPTTQYFGFIAIYAIVIILVMSVAKKITVMDDQFFIRRELLYEFRVFGGFLTLVGILIMFGKPMGWRWAAFWILEASVVGIAGMCAFATYWMLDMSKKHFGSAQMANETESDVQNLENILSDKVAVATFLKHLIRELSVENLFFLADVMHYKKSFIDNGKIQAESVPGFYKKVPDLLARYAYIPDRTFTHYSWALNQAYVDNISAFYVTAMADDTRDGIMDYLGDLDPDNEANMGADEWIKLCTVFDKASEQIYDMIKQSYKRFTKTSKFRNVDVSRLGQNEP